MLGKANQIGMRVFGSTSEYDEWQDQYGRDSEIIDIKFGMLPQSENWQYSYGILVIYRD